MSGIEKLTTFRNYMIIQQLRVAAGQSDVYAVRKTEGGDDQSYLLKIYKYDVSLPEKVLDRIMAISKDHPENLIRMYEVGLDEETGRYFEIQEFIQHASLNRIVAEMNEGNQDFIIRSVVEQTRDGLKILHDNNILHLDLKPSNILIRSNKPFNIVLTDFGLSSALDRETSCVQYQTKGLDYYQAPEVYMGSYHKKTDYWALGITLYELLLGENPFMGKKPPEVMNIVTNQKIEISDKIDKKYIPLLKGLLTKNIAARWGYEEVSRWFAGEEVSYETEKRYITPYRFNKTEYYTMKELFVAFALSEKNMRMAKIQLSEGFLIEWLKGEKDFDTATEIKLVIDDCGSDFGAALAELTRIYNPSAYDTGAGVEKKSEIDELLESLLNDNESKKKESPMPPSSKEAEQTQKSRSEIPVQPVGQESAADIPLSVVLGDGVSIELVWLSPGTFKMGSPEDEIGRGTDEKLHTVTLTKGYWLGKYPVTQGQWKRLMENNPSKFKKGDDYPVESVSWDDCQEFLKKLNEFVKKMNALPQKSGHFRLPTEAEWEYACRAGTQTRFYWGDDPDEKGIGEYC